MALDSAITAAIVYPPLVSGDSVDRYVWLTRVIEALRLRHNEEGEKVDAETLTLAEFNTWKADYWRPRMDAAAEELCVQRALVREIDRRDYDLDRLIAAR